VVSLIYKKLSWIPRISYNLSRRIEWSLNKENLPQENQQPANSNPLAHHMSPIMFRNALNSHGRWLIHRTIKFLWSSNTLPHSPFTIQISHTNQTFSTFSPCNRSKLYVPLSFVFFLVLSFAFASRCVDVTVMCYMLYARHTIRNMKRQWGNNNIQKVRIRFSLPHPCSGEASSSREGAWSCVSDETYGSGRSSRLLVWL
jgi:hypothetical protein